jgi:hypothetical protein
MGDMKNKQSIPEQIIAIFLPALGLLRNIEMSAVIIGHEYTH